MIARLFRWMFGPRYCDCQFVCRREASFAHSGKCKKAKS